MKFFKIYSLIVLVIICSGFVYPHGFAANTCIQLGAQQGSIPIQNISQKFFLGQKTVVATYKEKSKKWTSKNVQAAAFCQSCAFVNLSFINHENIFETIKCSPLQLFYSVDDQRWIPAYQLQDGDMLLCKNSTSVGLQSKVYIAEPIQLFIIEVKKHHTFAVGSAKILTHNMFIPIAATMGMAIPFDIVCSAGSFGCMFGPVTFCCSVAVAGIAAAFAYQYCKDKHIDFVLTANNPGCFEMQPVKDNLFLYCNLIEDQSNHEKNSGNPVGCFTLQPVQDDLFLCNDNQCKQNIKTVEDLLKDCKELGNTSGISKIYENPGTVEDMIKDFENLGLKNRKKFKDSQGIDAEYGFLSDGRKVTARITSTDERPTLEVTPLKNSYGKILKIRYGIKPLL